MQKTRLRIRFTKTDDLRWISHRDLARLWERLLRRANLQLAFSQGFHPKPRISFPSALALGVEAWDELVELELVGDFDRRDVERRIAEQLPQGMQILSLEALGDGQGKAKVAGFTFRITVPSELRATVQQRINDIRNQPSFVVQREKGTLRCDTSDPHFRLDLTDGQLTFQLPNFQQGSIKATDLLAALGIEQLLEQGAVLQRTAVHLASQNHSP